MFSAIIIVDFIHNYAKGKYYKKGECIMLNFRDNVNVYVKGFCQKRGGKVCDTPLGLKLNGHSFWAVITDLLVSDYLEVRYAGEMDGGNSWFVIAQDGKEYTLPKEPTAARYLKHPCIIGKDKSYAPIPCFEDEYKSIAKKIRQGDKSYILEYYINLNEVVQTSYLVDLWKENYAWHVRTKTGTHYYFYEQDDETQE